jgi:hypothetical protein
MTTTIDTIIGSFTIKPEHMPRISTDESKPTYSTLRAFQDAIQDNAMTIPSPQTELGHLALVVSPTDFAAANSTIPFVVPTDPGLAPVNPATATATGVTTRARSSESESAVPDAAPRTADLAFTGPEALRAFKEAKQTFNTYNQAKTALRNLIINSVHDTYICALKQKLTRYRTLEPLTILNHLWTTYGAIDAADNTANEARMKTPWNPPTPIEELFNQLEEGQLYAASGGEIIDDTQLMRWAYDNIDNTGLFSSDQAKWRKQPNTDKTWSKFKIYFIQCEHDRSKHSTKAETKYSANQVSEMMQAQFQSFLEQMEADKENQPPPLTDEYCREASANAITAEDIEKMIKKHLPGNNGGGRNNNNRTNSNRATTKEPPKAQALDTDGTPVTYCWTHGITRNLKHTSGTCTRQAEGHKTDATYSKRMGGSNERQQKRAN